MIREKRIIAGPLFFLSPKWQEIFSLDSYFFLQRAHICFERHSSRLLDAITFKEKLNFRRKQSAADPSKSTQSNLNSIFGSIYTAGFLLLVNTVGAFCTVVNRAFFSLVLFLFFPILFVWANLEADSLCKAWDLNVELSVIKSCRNNSSSS